MVKDVVVDEHLVSLIRCHIRHLIAQPPPFLLTRCIGQDRAVWQTCWLRVKSMMCSLYFLIFKYVVCVCVCLPSRLYTLPWSSVPVNICMAFLLLFTQLDVFLKSGVIAGCGVLQRQAHD